MDEDRAVDESGEQPPTDGVIDLTAKLDQLDEALASPEAGEAESPIESDGVAQDLDPTADADLSGKVAELVQVQPEDAFELQVRVVEPVEAGRPTHETEPSLARSAGEAAMSMSLRAVQQGVSAGWSLLRGAADSRAGRVVSDLAAGAMEALAEDPEVDWQEAGRLAEEQLGRMISVVVPVVVQSLDPAELMEYIDVNEIMDAVDVNALLDRVDVNTVLDRVDVNALLSRVDIDALLERVDLNEVLTEVDLNAVLERVDMDAVIERVDVAKVAKRAEIGELVAQSTTDVAGSVLDVGRRQAVALDTVVARTFNRILGRDSDAMPQGPPLLAEETTEPEA